MHKLDHTHTQAPPIQQRKCMVAWCIQSHLHLQRLCEVEGTLSSNIATFRGTKGTTWYNTSQLGHSFLKDGLPGLRIGCKNGNAANCNYYVGPGFSHELAQPSAYLGAIFRRYELDGGRSALSIQEFKDVIVLICVVISCCFFFPLVPFSIGSRGDRVRFRASGEQT